MNVRIRCRLKWMFLKKSESHAQRLRKLADRAARQGRKEMSDDLHAAARREEQHARKNTGQPPRHN